MAEKGLSDTVHQAKVRQSLELLAANMKPGDLAEADRRAQGWVPITAAVAEH
ncbi:MAG: hypothetical protein ACE5EM_06115 [Sphingomonadales bacterium]